ncbi:MAG TPA: alpha/beta fold hydrolase [Thermoanaerobaculia bacterium]|jgi:pimeloyl-ACP methyl ester carboxylesterase|nr:alpha/beta fold hydrolase [Thermoanaerobaculia bacterium]
MRIEWNGSPAEIRELGSGPVIVLIHGYPLDGAMWSGVARALAPKFRVLKPDLPGRGHTEAAAPETIAGYADFVEALLSELPGPVGLAGFSFGGYIALELMKRRPEKVRALALVDTRASADDPAGKAKRDETIGAVRANGLRPVVESMPAKLLSPESLGRPDLVERVQRMISRQKPETVEADLAAMRDRPDSTGFLPEIAVPTLVVVGGQDVLTPPADSEKMAAAIPGARLVTVPGVGHLTPMERPKAVSQVLEEFFAAALAG